LNKDLQINSVNSKDESGGSAAASHPVPSGAEIEGGFADGDATTVMEVPRIASALRHRDFRLFWTGNFLSNIGTWMQNVAQGWLVLEKTNSAFWLGVVGFASTIPIFLFALIGGVVADHVNKRKLLIVTQSAMMVFAFIMAILAYLKIITVTEIIVLAIGTGIAMSLNTPSYQALVPQLVPREDLINAIALNSAQFNMSRIFGPTLGGFAIAAVGVAGNFFLNGLSFLAVIIALVQLRYDPPVSPEEGHWWVKLKQGFSYVFQHEEMFLLVLMVAIASLLALPYVVFVPYFARDVLHSNERGLGILMACSGFGAFVGALTIAYLGKLARRGRIVFTCGLIFYAAIILFSLSRSFLFSGLLLVVTGYSAVLMVATINTLLQHLSSDAMRGRVMSIYSTAFLGLPPIGSLIAGLLADVVGATRAIVGMAVAAAIAAIYVYATRQRLRELD
jgi:MFS family permease